MDDLTAPDAPDVDNGAAVEFEPFPMADLPSAYWVGRASAAGMALGGTACHMLFEFEKKSYDVPRLEAALRLVVNRHKMLRCIVTEDGMNQVLRTVPPYSIRVVDKSHMDDAEFEEWRNKEWHAMLHRVFDASQWPLFDVQVILARNSQWMMTDFDHMTVDLRSMFIVFDEWQTIYAGKGHTLSPVPGFTYRMAVERMLNARTSPRYQNDQAYWFNRVDSLPGAPALPLQQPLASVTAPTFRRLEQYVRRDGAIGCLGFAFARVLTLCLPTMTALACACGMHCFLHCVPCVVVVVVVVVVVAAAAVVFLAPAFCLLLNGMRCAAWPARSA